MAVMTEVIPVAIESIRDVLLKLDVPPDIDGPFF